MKWSETITFNPELREVRLLKQTPSEDWTVHLREREEAAYQNGRKDGERAANQQMVKQQNEIAELRNGVLKSLQGILPEVIQKAEPELIQLALESAQRLVAGLPIDIALVEAVVREALRQVEDTAEIIVQLNPDDLELLRKHESTLLNGTPEGGAIRFTNSSETPRGDCIVQTKFGVIDARRETKVEQLKKSLGT